MAAVPYDLRAEFLYNTVINAQQNKLWEGKATPGLVWVEHEKLAVWPMSPGATMYFQQECGEGGQVATKRIKDGQRRGLNICAVSNALAQDIVPRCSPVSPFQQRPSRRQAKIRTRTAVTKLDAGEGAEHAAWGVERERERPRGLRLDCE